LCFHDFCVQPFLLLGFADAAIRVQKIELKQLEEMKEKVRVLIKTDWENVWKKDVDAIALSFLETMINIFKKHDFE